MDAISPAPPLPQERRSLFRRVMGPIGDRMPKGLYARALIIIIAPMVLLQSVVTFVFLERHWQTVTRRLSTVTVQNINRLMPAHEDGALTGGTVGDDADVSGLRERTSALCERRPLYPGFRGFTTYVAEG